MFNGANIRQKIKVQEGNIKNIFRNLKDWNVQLTTRPIKCLDCLLFECKRTNNR